MPRRLIDIPVTLWLTLAAVVVFCMPAAAELSQYDRVLVANGELWRLVTCHLAHWSFDHFLWDALTFALLGILCERQDRRRFIVCLGVSAALVSAGVCVFLPEMATYRGLSGIDTALFTLLAVMQLRERLARRRWDWVVGIGVLLVACVGKMGFEVLTGDVIFVDAAAAKFVPLPLVHIIGAAVGACVALAPATLSHCGRSPAFSTRNRSGHRTSPEARGSQNRASPCPHTGGRDRIPACPTRLRSRSRASAAKCGGWCGCMG